MAESGVTATAPATRGRWPVRAAGLAAVLLFLWLVARFWHPVYGFTRFLQLDSSNDNIKIEAFRAMPVFVDRESGGYDGLFYAQIAYHPSLTAAELARAVDSIPYRARRILAPLLAWGIALGNPAWIVHVYSLLNVAAWLLLGAWLWSLLRVERRARMDRVGRPALLRGRALQRAPGASRSRRAGGPGRRDARAGTRPPRRGARRAGSRRPGAGDVAPGAPRVLGAPLALEAKRRRRP